MKKLHVCLCEKCIEDLKFYNPWVDKDGKSLSLSEIEIKTVDHESCYNATDSNGNFINEHIASKYLY